MAELVWDAVDERPYELGVDHGVLSIDPTVVVPWNGLISVDEIEDDESELRSDFDGVTYVNMQFGGFYQAKVQAYAFPYSMSSIIGRTEVFPGLSLTSQPRAEFNFSYRTMIEETGYKIHLVHKAIATLTKRGATTISDDVEVDKVELVIDAVPPKAGSTDLFRPSAHMVINSIETDPLILEEFENTLYGSGVTNPYFPTQQEIIAIFST